MEVSIDDIGHAARIMSGFEAYSAGAANADVTYTKTCLRLNGVDLNKFSGNEGFMESIKAGGKKMYEMIVKLLKAIRDFFFGSSGSNKDKAVAKTTEQVKEVKKEITLTITKLEKGEAPVTSGGTRFTQAKMDSMLEEAHAATDQITKLMNGENFAQSIERWKKFSENYTSVLWDAEARAHYIRNIPQVKITDMSFGGRQLTPALLKVHDIIAKNKKSPGQNSMYIITSVGAGSEIISAMAEARGIAKKVLATVAIDLEHNNKEYNHLLGFDDEVLQNRGKEMQKLSADMVKVTNNLTALIKDLEGEIAALGFGVSRIANKLGIEYKNPLHEILAS